MYWANFLHIYQPVDQQKNILKRIINESYRPLVKIWLENPHTKITLNINACLTEMLAEEGYGDVVLGLKKLSELGRIEFTASAKYHPFLPILPVCEIKRQITLNQETNRKYFGKTYNPQGFFPPEMGYSQKVADTVAQMGYKWIMVDEIAYSGEVGTLKNDELFILKTPRSQKNDSPEKTPNKCYIFFRERAPSNHIASAISTNESLSEILTKEIKQNKYLLTAMDGETFGHHRPGLEDLLDKLMNNKEYILVTVSELFKYFTKEKEVSPLPSTWASTEEEMKKGIPYYLYYNFHNKLHRKQKKLINLAITATKLTKIAKVHHLLDQALSCNHMWWSNPDSWWSIEELEKGSYALNQTIKTAVKLNPTSRIRGIAAQAEILYQKVMEQAYSWQRSGLITELHMKKETFKAVPFKKRAKPGEYAALMEILDREEKKSVARKEYELAIRFRDAQIKLAKGLDVYYWIHIIDELRSEGKLGDYEKLTKKYQKQL